MINILNFKQQFSLGDAVLDNRENIEKEINEGVDNIINTEFNKVVLSIQKRYIKMSSEISKKVNSDLDDLDAFELDDYKVELLKHVEEQFKQATKDMINQIPIINE